MRSHEQSATRPKYETPELVPLGELARATGQQEDCTNGNNNTSGGLCANGNNAVGLNSCVNGNSNTGTS